MEDPLDLNMETEELINLPISSEPGEGSENANLHTFDCEPREADSGVKEIELNEEILENNEADDGNEGNEPFLVTDKDQDLVHSTTILQVSDESNKMIQVTENMIAVHTENGFQAVQDETPLGNRKREGSPISSPETDAVSGVKRSRITVDEQEASVHVIYNSLTRDSKHKLEELLQEWSEWHSRHNSSSHDSKGELESGEGTYFPALDVGLDKPSGVSFWIDNQARSLQSEEFTPLADNSVPLYDRGYSFGLTLADGSSNVDGGLEIVDASRCFNCGSYNHALKECPKPRDNAAVNSARKQHQTRHNQNASSRNPTRYYQDTPGGKYDGLRPGVLDAETRKLLGLKDLDPPPWLSRMREIGYPPGYLDPEEEDKPSGIRIFGDDDIKQEAEDGEILDDTEHPEPTGPDPPRKKSVEFPGLNAPIPENADESRWAARYGSSSFDPSRNRSQRRYNHSAEYTSKAYYHDQRWVRDFREDGPPGVDPGSSPLVSSFSPRFSDYDSSFTSHSPRGYSSTPGSPIHGKSVSERGRRSPLVHQNSFDRDHYSSENCENDRWNGFSTDSSFHRNDRHEEHLPHSRR